MKTIMLKPNSKKSQYGKVKNLSCIEPPIWLALMAHKFGADTIIDAEALDLNIKETVILVESYKPNRVVILATGSHPSAHIQQTQVMNELANYIKKFTKVETFTNLPCSPTGWTAKWDLLPMNKYRAHNWHTWGHNSRQPYGVTYTSISCPFNCEFCCVKSFYGDIWEQRTIEAVISDIDILVNKYNIKHIKFMDELFTFNINRAELICDVIIDMGYKDLNIWTYARIDSITPKSLKKFRKAGIRWLAYGIETGNENIRKNILKGKFDNNKVKEVIKMTKDAGIYVLGNFMFGFWEDTLNTMKETLNLAKELQCEYSNFYCVVAYPNSKLYDKMKAYKVKLPTNWESYAQMSYNFEPLPTKYLSNKEVLKFRDNAFLDYFRDEKYIRMMRETFGDNVVKEIRNMTNIVIERDLLND